MKLSYSKLSSFLNCQQKFKFQYIDRLKGEQQASSSAELGKYIHKVLETWREGLDIKEIAEIHRKNYTIAEQEYKSIPLMLENAESLYQPYVGLPFNSEWVLNYELKDQHGEIEPIEINGIIDKVYIKLDGSLEVVDYKTGRSKSDNSLQMRFYTYLINKGQGIPCDKINCKVFYLRLRQSVPYSFTEEDMVEFENWIWQITEAINRTERFNHHFSFLCKFCQYRNTDCQQYKMKQQMVGKD